MIINKTTFYLFFQTQKSGHISLDFVLNHQAKVMHSML